ncbi:hypothetical protein CAPTEDRAFT_157534 [Capitella teleta]|uniref:MKS transition zone complex subunit 1 n=1 Tax=Capitella teleta TaxID=283909 RepID=R7URQ4_CAPTE|nr:hypothetical protein CAPTEDRAFT_157534 [Capitella teleta]|eukprot:ELU09204.1 hypothetical protein CAPTEDRAFT_157534 [Capitella teleta]
MYEPDYGSAFYRSQNSIKNLKVRINLERVTSASIVPQVELEQEAGSDLELKEARLKQNFGGQKDVETYTFKWQEKVFCQREINIYGDSSNCHTVLERKYHQDINQLKEQSSRPTKRLFSYVEHDSFTCKDENVRMMTTSPNEGPTIMAEKMNGLRHRRAPGNRVGAPKMNLVDLNPSEDLIKQNHLMSTPVQTMYIMADLTPSSREPNEADEFVICTIRVDGNGVLSIKPDFNKGGRPYKLEAPGMGRDMFDYTIEHGSILLSRQDQERENKMQREFFGRHAEYNRAHIGYDFEPVPGDMLRQVVYGEIESAKDFEYGDLYISFFLDLPDGWLPNGQRQLQGVTQTCSTKVIGRDNVAYFSFPFEFDLYYKQNVLDEKGNETLPSWPQLYIEVLSLDSWQRYRTEGYGFFTLPCRPGVHREDVHCWRPAGQSAVSELRRFFIGGSPELEDVTYAAKPSTFDISFYQGKRLSKFGFRTISTGSVSLRMNVIQQSQSFLRTSSSKKKVGHIMDRIGYSHAQVNIANVLDAFQRAKQRMISARDTLRTGFQTLKAYEPEDE